MKPILFIVNIILTVGSVSAQSYESIFGSRSTQWNITIGNLWGTSTAIHTVTGDIIINGIEYKIVDGYGEDFLGFLREDTIQGRAWYKNNRDTAEILIMDLKLAKGDSMYISGNWNSYPGYYHVDSVFTANDRIHIQFSLVQAQFLNEPFTLIEGVTSNMGFRFQDRDYINNLNTRLLCSYKNGTKIYGTEPCEISDVGIDEVYDDFKIEIFPNPVDKYLRLEVENVDLKDHNFKIYNTYGRIIKLGKLNAKSKVEVGNFPSGVYLLSISDIYEGKVHFVKFIKK